MFDGYLEYLSFGLKNKINFLTCFMLFSNLNLIFYYYFFAINLKFFLFLNVTKSRCLLLHRQWTSGFLDFKREAADG